MNNGKNGSIDAEAADKLKKQLYCTRVDLKTKVAAHSNPEE